MEVHAIIIGQAEVLANIGTSRQRAAAGLQRGLVKAGLRLQAESQKMVPVEYGPLKASAFTRADGTGFATIVTVGYTAAYAAYVHELVGMKLKGVPRPSGIGKYWDPAGAQAKFLEEPARRLGPSLQADILAEMRI